MPIKASKLSRPRFAGLNREKNGLPKVKEYTKNVMKSIAFASVDAIKQDAPGISDFLSTNNDTFKEAYNAVIDYKSSLKKVNRNIKNSKIYEALDYGAHNLIEDIKSGNLYNTTRSSLDSMFSFDDSDFDGMDDFSFDDDDFDVSSSSSSSNSSSKFEASMATAATTQATAVAMSANYIVGSNKQSTKLVLGQMDRLSAGMTAGFSSMYSSMSVVNKFLDGPMQTHLENSRKYYEETTRMMQEQNAMLKELLEMQRNLYKKPVDRYKGINNTFDDIVGSGALDLNTYGKNVIKNFKQIIDSSGILSMLGGSKSKDDPNMLKAMFDNPLGLILPGIINGMLGKEFKDKLKSFDKGITSLFSQFIAELDAYKGDYSLKGLLASIFGVNVNNKRSINTGKYEKGPVPFDGITRTAIVETIPGYLARIEKALTGNNDAMHYDYQRGQWTSEEQIRRNLEQRKYDYMDRGTSGIRDDTRDLVNQLASTNKKAADQLQSQIDHMRETIFNDKGRFRYEGQVKGREAYDYYGFSNKKDFDKVVASIKKDTIRDLAARNMRANNDYGNFFTMQENEGGGIYRQIYNKGEDVKKIMDGGTGIIAASADRFGRNVFNYLSDILDEIRNISGKKRGRYNSPKSRSNKPSKNRQNSNSASSDQDSSSNEEPPQEGSEETDEEADKWRAAEENNRREDEENENSEGKLGKVINGLFGQTKLGKALNNFGGLLGNIIRAPLNLATKLLDKADKNLFKMMFGDNKNLVDKNGNKIDNLFDYTIYQIKNGIDDIKKKIDNILDPIKQKIKDFLTPKFQRAKEILKKGKERLGKSIDNTFGRAARAAANTKAGKKFTGTKFGQAVVQNVMSAEDAENILNNNDDNTQTTDDINTSAMGRIVTKRGLTMISPGEVIIPASFDRNVQKKQLALEKRDRSRIVKAIGLNAEGTVDTEKIKDRLNKLMSSLGDGKGKAIWDETKKNSDTVGAGGLLGLGASVLTGFNPILGAAVGAGISMISTSDTFKKIVLGDIDENGEREGGLVPKSVIKFFKKYSGDMLDFGVAGGILGLFGPFGVLGGAAMGAGVGFLKNNDTFKKFIFGTDDEEGLISKDTQKKFTEFAKKAAPNIGVGVVAGALLGPFGILGNAAMGAGLGMLSSTDAFHKFLFGDEDEGTDGIMGAFKRGVLEPAANIVKDIKKKFDGYLEKNIFNPLKNFGKVMGQEIKNTIMNIGDKISDHIRDSYEKNIGLPMRDFIQERLFKPLTKLLGGALKGALGIGGKAIAAPFSLMNWVANNTRAKQIKHGQAYDMTAQERLDWRANHKVRMVGGDKTKGTDELIAGMSDEDVSKVAGLLGAYGKGSDELLSNLGDSKKNLSNAMSNAFNADLRNTIGVGKMDRIAKAASSGDWEQFEKMVTKDKKLSDEQKQKLLKQMKPYVSAVAEAKKGAEFADKSDDEIAQMLEQMTGKKFNKNDRKSIRQAYRAYAAEDKNRKKHAKGAEEIVDSNGNPVEGGEEVIARTAQAINEAVNNNSKTIIDKLTAINNNLDQLLGKEPSEPNPVEGGRTAEGESSEKPAGSDKGTEGSKAIEAIKQKEDEEEKDQVQRDQLNEQKQTTSIWKRMYNKLFGEKEDRDDSKRKHGFFGALSNGFAGILGALGIGQSKIGKILGTSAKVIIGLSLIGHFSGLLKDKVLPAVSKFLFGTANEDGTRQGGLLGPVINWVKSPDGLQKFLSDKVIPWLVTGVGLVATNIISPLATAAVKTLPTLAYSVVTGVWKGIKSLFKGDGNLPGGKNLMSDATSSNDEVLSDASSEMSNYSSKLASDTPSSITKKFKTTISLGKSKSNFVDADGNSIDLDNYDEGDKVKAGFDKLKYDEDGNEITQKGKKQNYYVVEKSNGDKYLRNTNGWSKYTPSKIDEDTNRTWVKASGIAGLLGAKESTGQIMYDENGNPVTTLGKYNTDDTIASTMYKGGRRAFINAITNTGGAGLTGLLGNLSGKGFGFTPFGKIITGTAAKIGKGIGGVAQLAGAAGSAAKASLTGGNAKTAFVDAISNEGLHGFANTTVNKGIGEAIKEAFNKSGIGKVVDKAKNVFSKNAASTAANAATDAAQDTASKALALVNNNTDDVAQAAIKEGTEEVLQGVAPSLLQKVAKFLTKQVGETALTKAMKELADELCKNMFEKLAGKALKSVAKAIENVSIIGIATIVIDFFYGCDNAETLLGVAKDDKTFKVNIGHRILCGLLNVINERITLGLIPCERIIDLIIKLIFPVLGFDATGLEEARSNAADIISKYNEEHPEDTVDNLKDYNNKDKFFYKAGKAIKKTFSNAVSTVGAVFNGSIFKSNKKKKDQSNSETESGGDGHGSSGSFDIQTNAEGGLVTKGGLSMVSAGETILDSGTALSSALGNLLNTPLGFMKESFNGVKDGITSAINKYKTAKNAVEVSSKKIDMAIQSGDDIDVFSKDYWTIKSDSNADGVLGVLSDIQSYLNRVINAPLLIVKSVGEKFLTTLDASKDLLKDKYDNVWEWVKSFFGGGKGRVKVTTTANKKKSLWNKLFGKGRHEYQDDPNISNMKYGDSTIGDSGCGPVAAANLINNMKNSKKKMSVGKAAKYAEDHNMTVEGGGTDIGYFKSIFNSQGIPAKSTSSKDQVLKSLKNGNQVVMLGKDKNGSKSSPFGNDYHYVTAKGLDTDGNILAEDPDLPQSTVKYNTKDMLDSMITSVATSKINGRSPKKGGRGRKSGLYGRKMVRGDIVDGGQETDTGSAYPAGTEIVNNFPYFCQYDDTWGPQAYGPTTIKDGGCGPTSTAMVLRSYGVSTNPKEMADFSIAHGDRIQGQGTAHKLFSDAANAYGLTCKNIGTSLDAIKSTLSNGIPLIASGTNGGVAPYSSCGHIITMVGLDEKGRIVVNDPVSRARSVAYDDSVISNGLANTYSIDSNGKGSLVGGRISPNYQGKSATSGNTSASYSSSSSGSSSSSSGDSSSGTTGNLFTALTNLGKSIMKAMFGKDAFNALFGDSSDDSSDGSRGSGGFTNGIGGNSYSNNSVTGTSNGSTIYNSKTFAGANNEEKIWNALRSKGLSPESAAGVMGNLMKESGLISKQLENGYEQPASYYGDSGTWPGFTDQSYTDYVDKNGKWPEYGASGWDYYNKVHRDDLKNHVGYGLAGWTHCAFKDPFLAGAKANNVSIGDAGYQTNFLLDQINGQYSDLFSRMNGYNDVKKSTIDFYNTYEYGNPNGHMEESHPDLFANRYEYATQFYEKYKNMEPGVNNDDNTDQVELPDGKTASKDYTKDPDEKEASKLEAEAKDSLKNTSVTNGSNNFDYTDPLGQTKAGKGRRLYGKGRDGIGAGVATSALNGLSNYSDNTTGPIMAANAESNNGLSGSITYDQFLKTIVEILSAIAGNTAALSKILEILSNKFGVDISSSDVSDAVSNGRTKARDALSQLVARSSNNNVNVSSILNTKDTAYILNAMAAVATE